MIFVFGSNLAGRHGKGAAFYALMHHGAIKGQPRGLQGSSYAIPTKDARLRPLPLEVIRKEIQSFILFAKDNPHLEFDITPVGCGYAGYQRSQIRPFFAHAPSNCHFNRSWDHEE
jgi:hypothetical protein